MSVFIKVDNSKVISVAGTIANQQMLDEGYFEYDGEIPSSTYLKYIDGQVIKDTTLALLDAKKTILAKYQPKFYELKLTYLAKLGLGINYTANYQTQYNSLQTTMLTELNTVVV